MANEQEIESWKKAYQDKPDSDLIHATHRWVPHCAQHIAAQMVLAERREKRAEDRHKEIELRLNELKKPHWTVHPNFWVTVVAAIAALVAAYFAWRPQQPLVVPPPPGVPALQSAPPVSAPSSPQKPQPLPAPQKP